MKNICVLAAAAIMAASSATSVMAQSPLSFGVRAGLNINSLRGKGAEIGGGKSLDSKVGFNVGALAGYNFTDMLGLQAGLLLNTRGAKFEESGEKMSINIYELQVPVFLTGTFSLNDDLKIKANVGPTFGIGLSAKSVMEMGSEKTEGDLYKKPEGGDAPTKRFDFGVAAGAGVEFKKIYLGVGYDLGVTSIRGSQKDDKDNYGDYLPTIKTGSLTINLGYTF